MLCVTDKVLSGKFSKKDVGRLVEGLKENKVEEVAKVINFALQCAGAEGVDTDDTTECISTDQDLDGLEADEIGELLSDVIHQMDEKNIKTYPLLGSNKQTKGLRASYRLFWESLADELSGKGDSDKHGMQGIALLNLFVDTLVALSSMYIANIRDVATEAVLAIGRSITTGCVDLRERQAILQRQMKAEKAQSSRHQAIQKNKGRVDAVSYSCSVYAFAHTSAHATAPVRIRVASNLFVSVLRCGDIGCVAGVQEAFWHDYRYLSIRTASPVQRRGGGGARGMRIPPGRMDCE